MSTAVIILLVWCGASLLAVGASLWFLFVKAGQKGWYALVPLYNSYVTNRVTVSKAPMTGALLGLVCAVLSLLIHNGMDTAYFTEKGRIIIGLIPFGFCMLVTAAITCSNMAEVFDKPDLFGVGMFFLPFVFWPLLAITGHYLPKVRAQEIGEDVKSVISGFGDGSKALGKAVAGEEYAGENGFCRAGSRVGSFLNGIPLWFRAFARGFIGREYTQLDFLKLPGMGKRMYRIGLWLHSIPLKIWGAVKKLGKLFVRMGQGIVRFVRNLVDTFVHGDWKTRVSYVVMGFGSCARGQWLRGILFFLFQTAFNIYLFRFGGWHLSMLGSLGTIQQEQVDGVIRVEGHNSFFVLLFGVLTIFFIAGFVYTWYQNIKQNRISEEILRSGHKLKTAKDDVDALADEQFHKTLLALPSVGVLVFTILPIFFMILIAFTSYDFEHYPPSKLFSWDGFKHFSELTSLSTNTTGASWGFTFRKVLLWTLVWAFFATFLNYFLGMLVAIMINKKGIRIKKVWRTILVMTIAIPQFVSLMYVANLFTKTGLINTALRDWGWISNSLPFWEDETWSKVTIILINVWIGIPYLMLIATGILMNIPADLYESARIDGANGFQMYKKITLPYMLFVTGPYLLTSFTGNINNFNVIYLLNQGGKQSAALAGHAGYNDLLITWLFKMTTGTEPRYNLAAVIGILVFVVTAVINLIVYNMIPSVKNEEDFQ